MRRFVREENGGPSDPKEAVENEFGGICAGVYVAASVLGAHN